MDTIGRVTCAIHREPEDDGAPLDGTPIDWDFLYSKNRRHSEASDEEAGVLRENLLRSEVAHHIVREGVKGLLNKKLVAMASTVTGYDPRQDGVVRENLQRAKVARRIVREGVKVLLNKKLVAMAPTLGTTPDKTVSLVIEVGKVFKKAAVTSTMRD
ncbi:hypothetical protein CspHIS471_0702780 [Cutaneotrichosporon sp. HIS471]|nr:hypothetical protein CspHIS471_0702780 [Cutaneotrichosporon sp. HIS471]